MTDTPGRADSHGIRMNDMITYNQFLRQVAAVNDCSDLDSYIREQSGSVRIGGEKETVKMLGVIWDMAHDGMTIKQIAAACGISVRQIGIRLGIPARTVEQWSAGVRNPPEWQMPLIAYAVIADMAGDMDG